MRPLTTALAALLLPSCATILTPGPDAVTVTSEPAGAFVIVDGQWLGVTPCTVPVMRQWGQGDLVLQLGDQEVRTHVDRAVNPATFGNLLIGGWPGLWIDSALGNVRTAVRSKAVTFPEFHPDSP